MRQCGLNSRRGTQKIVLYLPQSPEKAIVCTGPSSSKICEAGERCYLHQLAGVRIRKVRAVRCAFLRWRSPACRRDTAGTSRTPWQRMSRSTSFRRQHSVHHFGRHRSMTPFKLEATSTRLGRLSRFPRFQGARRASRTTTWINHLASGERVRERQ